jgi:hypothetical protein
MHRWELYSLRMADHATNTDSSDLISVRTFRKYTQKYTPQIEDEAKQAQKSILNAIRSKSTIARL